MTRFFADGPVAGDGKSWAVFFRFVGSRSGVVKYVTGMEDGALEVPWMEG